MQTVFNNYSAYYDLLYQDKDYQAEIDYIINLIKQHHPAALNIIEFGPGTGKHASLLATNGFDVTGIEPSAEMIKIANLKTKSNLNFFESSIETYVSAKQFDVALSLFHVMSYVTSNESLNRAFTNVSQSLKPGGIFIFDIWYTPAVLTQIPEKRIKTMENDEIKVVRHATPQIHWNRNVIDVNYEIEVWDKSANNRSKLNEIHEMRHFSIPEIELFAKNAGFELVATHEFLTGKTAGPDTWGVCFILQKI